jgi:methionine-R-sulfoxide reductase
MNLPARYRFAIVAGVLAFGIWTVLAVADDLTTGEKSSSLDANTPTTESAKEDKQEEEPYVPKTKRELQRSLTRIQYDVTQNEATEPAFRNMYWNNKKEGVYNCVVCDHELFSSRTKYESGTGWPSFYAPIETKRVGTRTDYRLFFARTEVHCARCNAHLGHVFEDGPRPTGLRYCMNSASLKFVEKSDAAKEDSDE